MVGCLRHLALWPVRLTLPVSTLHQRCTLVYKDILVSKDRPNVSEYGSWVQKRAFSSSANKTSDMIDKDKGIDTTSPNMADTTKLSVVTDTLDVTDTTNDMDTTEVTDFSHVTDTTLVTDTTNTTATACMESSPTLAEMTDSLVDELSEAEATRLLEKLSEQDKLRLGKAKAFWLENPLNISMPKEMSNRNWLKLMKIRSFKQQIYFFRKFANTERRKERNEQKMEIKKQGHMDEAKPVPGIFEKGFLNQYHNYTGRYAQLIRKTKGYQSLMFGSPLVFDYAFEEHSQKKGYFLANIMAELYQTNIAHQEPFHFHLTGVFNNGYLEKGMKNQTNFLDVHKRDICDIFPPEKLVYLAPHSETPLNLQAEDILVLGATTFFHTERILTQIPWELKRAEELGIRTAFLPVNSFIRHMIQKKQCFPSVPVLKALLDYNFTRDWDTALKHLNTILTEKDLYKLKMWEKMNEKEDRRKKDMTP